MNIVEYQEQANRTCVNLTPSANFQHMLLGIISEVGELADAYKKTLAYGKVFDTVNRNEETADSSWYIANLATFLDVQLHGPIRLDKHLRKINFVNHVIGQVQDAFYPEQKYRHVVGHLAYFLKKMDYTNPQTLLNQWYTTCLLIGVSKAEFYMALDRNIKKLQKRYPEKFTTHNALHRNLIEERKVLAS